MTANKITTSAAKNSDQTRQLLLRNPPNAMSPYIPYLIAISFVVMTGLLTLILTLTMDYKSQMDRALAKQADKPILADARMAFGQLRAIINPPTPGLLQNNSAVSPVVESIPTNPAQTTVPVASDNSSEDTQSTDKQPTAGLSEYQIAASRQDLDQLIDRHENRITEIRTIIAFQVTHKQQIDELVIRHIHLMERQIQAIDDRLRPIFPQAVASYERIMNRRRESFQHIIQTKEKLLRRIDDSREQLREHYTQLLKTWHEGNIA